MAKDTGNLSVAKHYWNRGNDDVAEQLKTTPRGLTTIEASSRLKVRGPNSLVVHSHHSALRLFVKQFTNPLVLILLFAVVVSLFVGEWTDAAVIFAIVLGSAVITFAQEYSASKAVAKLRARLTHYVTAIRDGEPRQVAAETIVPGDVVLLSAGSLIPADGVVLEEQDLYVNQAILTGETFPVEKEPGPTPESASLSERTNCVFMGTSVRSGTANVLIVTTGADTEYGKIADVVARQAPETEFERGIRRFGYLLTRMIAVLIIAVFAINLLSNKPTIDSLLFAIALAVGLSPELLPAIITINLSKGAREMAKRGVIVRRLEAIENLGSMDVLCTDKTGTLTEGVVRLDASLAPDGEPSDRVLRLAFLNASLQTGLPNPLDEAITTGHKIDISDVTKISEVPYDFQRKRLSILVETGSGEPEMITKGALDNVLDVCDRVRIGDQTPPLDVELKEEIGKKFKEWSKQGFRVLGIASKPVSLDDGFTREEEKKLIFEGFLLFFDPPKSDSLSAIDALAALGVKLKIITGDNRHVAAHVAEKVGLKVEGILTGAELNTIPEEALWHRAEHTTLFVEVDPNQKERIIDALRKAGHVVGYMGDGINDAPALHEADVGISVESAVDVAREAAEFVLLKKGLLVLRDGIEEGRTTFANSLKYVFTTTSANFGNMFSMAGASLFLPFLPLLAKQILLNNFLSDIPAIAIASDNVDREAVEMPHRWDIKFIRNFMIVFGLVSSVFDFLTFGLLYYVIEAAPEEFRTGWFIESLLTELLVALIVRTRRPFYKSRPSRWLAITTAAVVVLTIFAPYLPVSEVFGFVPLPATVMLPILVITILYVLATEFAKQIFYRRVGTV